MYNSIPVIGVLNQATGALPVALEELVKALRELEEAIRRVWPVQADVDALADGSHLPLPWVWPLIITDRSDQVQALGYHTLREGRPVGYVALEDAQRYGVSLAEVVGHEFAELLTNPNLVLSYQGYGGTSYAGEIVDPVQGSTYLSTGKIPLPNFVYPAWFGGHNPPGIPAQQYDHLGQCQGPYTCLSSGYISVYVPGMGWTNSFGGPAGQQMAAMKAQAPHGRMRRRAARC